MYRDLKDNFYFYNGLKQKYINTTNKKIIYISSYDLMSSFYSLMTSHHQIEYKKKNLRII